MNQPKEKIVKTLTIRQPTSLSPTVLVMGTVSYHQPGPENEAVVSGKPWQYTPSSQELPYRRNLVLTESWTKLDTGYLRESGGLVFLENMEGKFLRVPTEQEKTSMSSRVIELCLDGTGQPFAQIRPGHSHHFDFSDPQAVLLRCRKGQCRVLLVVYPG